MEIAVIAIEGLQEPVKTSARKLYEVGDRVRVVDATDGTCDIRFIGMSGIVVRRQYSTAHVGESRRDPFYTVRFGKVRKQDGFWHEELALVRKGKR